MIKLSKHDSTLLGLTKGWDLRGVIRFPTDSNADYVGRACQVLYGMPSTSKYSQSALYDIYCNLAEKLLTPRQLLRAFEWCEPTSHAWTMTPFECLKSELSMVAIFEKEVVLIDMDMTALTGRDYEEEKTRKFGINYIVKEADPYDEGNTREVAVTVTTDDLGKKEFFDWIKKSKCDWRDVYIILPSE